MMSEAMALLRSSHERPSLLLLCSTALSSSSPRGPSPLSPATHYVQLPSAFITRLRDVTSFSLSTWVRLQPVGYSGRMSKGGGGAVVE